MNYQMLIALIWFSLTTLFGVDILPSVERRCGVDRIRFVSQTLLVWVRLAQLSFCILLLRYTDTNLFYVMGIDSVLTSFIAFMLSQIPSIEKQNIVGEQVHVFYGMVKLLIMLDLLCGLGYGVMHLLLTW